MGLIQSPSFSRQPSLRSQLSASSPIPEEEDLRLHAAGGADGGAASCLEAQDHEDAYRDKDLLKQDSSTRKRANNIAAEAQKHQLHLSNLNNALPNMKLSSNERILRDVTDKTIDLSQRLLEETIRMDNLSKQIEEVELGQRDALAALNGRFCNGDFIWRVSNFSVRCAELKNNLSTYSPPFYTSQYGYKCCVRLAVKWRHEQYFLSLFILLMKGEYDDILEWPFDGKITLGVLDYSNSCPKQHVIDSVVSNPELQAFQRPQGHRNEKSFGFTYFHPLEALDSSATAAAQGQYLVGDVLCVRAKVVSSNEFGEKLSPDHVTASERPESGDKTTSKKK